MCQEFGHVNSTGPAIWKNRNKINSVFETERIETKAILKYFSFTSTIYLA